MNHTALAGVIGVGTMGQHHARVYEELPGVTLAGVTDHDDQRAEIVAQRYGTVARSRDELLETVDVISVAAPTRYHEQLATEAIEYGVDVLVEKPFVTDIETGRDIAARAEEAGVTLQVGHVERFNPAVRALDDIVSDLDVIAVAAQRLGPPVDRDLQDSVVRDLMIHDIDVIVSHLDSPVTSVAASSPMGQDYVTAHLEFDSGIVASLTASRVTQEKIRELAFTATDCRVDVDYASQSVQVHRHSLPEYYQDEGGLRYRHESIIERPTVENGEPLKAELSAFVEAATGQSEPVVSAADGLRALDIAIRIEQAAGIDPPTAH
jgi:predicted dehydrogenase